MSCCVFKCAHVLRAAAAAATACEHFFDVGGATIYIIRQQNSSVHFDVVYVHTILYTRMYKWKPYCGAVILALL